MSRPGAQGVAIHLGNHLGGLASAALARWARRCVGEPLRRLLGFALEAWLGFSLVRLWPDNLRRRNQPGHVATHDDMAPAHKGCDLFLRQRPCGGAAGTIHTSRAGRPEHL